MLVILLPHLGEELREGAAGLVADPDFVFGAERGADVLQLGVDRLVRQRLDSQLGLAGGVQLEVSSQGGVSQTLHVHEESEGGRRGKRASEGCAVPSPHPNQKLRPHVHLNRRNIPVLFVISLIITLLYSAPRWYRQRKLGYTQCLHLGG